MEWALGLLSQLLAEMQAEIGDLLSAQWWHANALNVWNIIVIDVVLAGDNAIVVGLAASRVAPDIRAKVIFWGIAGAVVLRILFAAVTSQLLQIVGLTLAGGILLLWVCWKMYREVTGGEHIDPDTLESDDAVTSASSAGTGSAVGEVSFGTAIFNIILADLSMSLDNVLAVAGAAKGSTLVLVFGLFVAVVLMAIASHFIARLLVRYPWITWIGLLIILYIALEMIYHGSHQVACTAYSTGCTETLYSVIKGSIFGHR